MSSDFLYITPHAWTVPFEGDLDRGNGFPEDLSTQEAIEFAKQNAEGFPRAGIPLIYNGTVSNNAWISYSNLTPNVPIPWAVKTEIKELTWANQDSRDDRDFDLEIYRVQGNTQTVIATLSVRNSQYHYGYWSGLSYVFEAGEALRIRYKDQGKNCADLCLVPWFSRVQE